MAGSKLKIDIRRNKIMEQLRREGRVSVTQLSEALGTTAVTIRNDLTALERDGYLLRTQGGAVLLNKNETRSGAVTTDVTNIEEKNTIAQMLVALIKDGDTLFINSGTTTQVIAGALKVRANLNIVTNSLVAATILGEIPSFRVLLLGGELNAQYGFTYGGDAATQLGKFQADWAILSVDGISARGGLTTHHAEEAVIDRMMIAGARKTWIAADHTKIGRTGFARICEDLAGIGLATDSKDAQALQELKGCGVEIISL